MVAQRLGLDPADVRRKNFIGADAFPYTTSTGLMYDSGTYAATMDKALATIDYAGLRKEQAELRKQGRYLGIGLSTYVEVCGMGPSAAMPAAGWDSATIRDRADRERHGAHRDLAARPRRRDDVRPDRRRRARGGDRSDQRHPRRYRQGAVRRRHVRIARHGRRRCGAHAGDRNDSGESGQDRRAPVGSEPRRRRVPQRTDRRQGRSVADR